MRAHEPFVELIAEAIEKKIDDAKRGRGMATKLETSALVEKQMSIMTSLERLYCEESELQ